MIPKYSTGHLCLNKTAEEMEQIIDYFKHAEANGQTNFCKPPCSAMEVCLKNY